MRRLKNSGTANTTKPATNSSAWVTHRVTSTSVNWSWSIHRYFVHTSEARTRSAMSTPSAITVIIRGEILRGSPEPPSGAGRGRGRGMSPNWAEKLTDNLWCLEVGAHAGPHVVGSQNAARVQCGAAVSHGGHPILSGRTCKGPLDPMTTPAQDPLDAPTAALAAAVLEVARHVEDGP